MDVSGILAQVVSHAMTTGLFESVNQHEPKNAPGNGMTCCIWADQITPVQSSGLASTSVRVCMYVRLYTSMIQQPYDAIDPSMMTAVDVLLGAYSGAFTLGGAVRDVDLLGQHGVPLSAKAGYISQDQKTMRVMTITLPLVVNDVWAQVA